MGHGAGFYLQLEYTRGVNNVILHIRTAARVYDYGCSPRHARCMHMQFKPLLKCPQTELF